MSDQAPAPQEDRLGIRKVQDFLSRIQITGVNLSDFPAPPEDPLARKGLMILGGGVALVGGWGVLMALWSLNGTFLCAAVSAVGLGVATALYSRPDLALAEKPMPDHPSSRDGELRSAWETYLTLATVVGLTNLALGVLVTALLWLMLHWSASLAAALLLNAAAAFLGYQGDGINRRPILTGAAMLPDDE